MSGLYDEGKLSDLELFEHITLSEGPGWCARVCEGGMGVVCVCTNVCVCVCVLFYVFIIHYTVCTKYVDTP